MKEGILPENSNMTLKSSKNVMKNSDTSGVISLTSILELFATEVIFTKNCVTDPAGIYLFTIKTLEQGMELVQS